MEMRNALRRLLFVRCLNAGRIRTQTHMLTGVHTLTLPCWASTHRRTCARTARPTCTTSFPRLHWCKCLSHQRIFFFEKLFEVGTDIPVSLVRPSSALFPSQEPLRPLLIKSSSPESAQDIATQTSDIFQQ